MRIGSVCFEQVIMAIRTGEHAKMFDMSERDDAKIRDGNRYGIYRMARRTFIELRSFRIVLVVAGSTRLTLLHFSHGHGRILFAYDMEDRIVTGSTVVVQLIEVIFMAEGDVSGILGFKK